LVEGFGLPVLESVQHGRPCICSARGALGEAARGGGVLAIDTLDAAGIASAMRRLLTEPTLAAELRAQACTRKFRSWNDYASELLGWMATLTRRS
jgi:glycosyltransferase involved in cell wall biosynthesis